MFKITLAQMKVLSGQPSVNFRHIQRWVKKAKEEGADCIVFPELALTGYVLGDQWNDQSWVEFAASFNEQIKNLSQDIGIIWGNVYLLPNHVHRDGRIAKINAAFFAQDGQWVARENGQLPGLYFKHLLPNYRVFDESRHFVDASSALQKLGLSENLLLSPFMFKTNSTTLRIGLEICEDLWDQHDEIKISQHYVKQKVDGVINLSASPWTIDKQKSRQKQGKSLLGVPWIYVNRVGVENNGKNIILYDGGSFVVNAEGTLLHQLNGNGEEALATVSWIEKGIIEQPIDQLYTLLLQGLRYVHDEVLGGKRKWVVGLSGGIDSAVSTALLATAIGPQSIHAYSLPTQFNSNVTQKNAGHISRSLGISFQEVPIQTMVDSVTYLTPQEGKTELLNENLQARIRGVWLMNEAQRLGAVVLNNGNKIEIALGYATLYGDTIGAIAPLGDLTKMQINDLAKTINAKQGKIVIPENLIAQNIDGVPTFEFPPSAELKPQQRDPMKWGYHDWLVSYLTTFPTLAVERVLTLFIEKQFPADITVLLKHYGLYQGSAFMEDLEWFLRSWQLGIFKRIQLPPNILVSRGAFGFDYRESQMTFEKTPQYEKLKALVLTATL